MIPFEEIDDALKTLGKDRAWLVAQSGRSPGAIRSALAPAASPQHRSELLQRALSDAIERERVAQAAADQDTPPGFKSIFLTDEQVDRADRASRAVNATSLAEFCRDAILFRATEILAGATDPVADPSPKLTRAALSALPPAAADPAAQKSIRSTPA